MSTRRFIVLLILFMLPGMLNAHAQSTMVVLPTNDDTSAFEVKNEDGTIVLEAKADGNVTVNGTMSAQEIEVTSDATIDGDTAIAGNATVDGSVSAATFIGDGSTLSNVRPIVAYVGGNMNIELTTSDQVVKYVEISVPSAGKIIVNAVCCAEFKSAEKEMYRASITTGTSLDYSYLMAGSQLADPDAHDHAESFGAVRGYTVSSPGTYRYNFVANKAYGDISFRDVSMTATFYPTSGAGASKIVLPEDAQPAVGGSGPLDQP